MLKLSRYFEGETQVILLIQVCLQVLRRTTAQPFVVPLGAAQSLMSDAA